MVRWSRPFGWEEEGEDDDDDEGEESEWDGSESVMVIIPRLPDGDDRGLDEIEDPLIAVIEENGLGEFDGHGQDLETGEIELFMYGHDAEQLFAAIEPTLRDLRLPAGTRVIVQSVGVEREVFL